ncbi:hypothetical protein IXO159_01120 [Xanthomonas oryzae pv. oryzae]|nr:hypothetical protein IXO159_01120 [Xanthomonas oryzae pv. oryzae]
MTSKRSTRMPGNPLEIQESHAKAPVARQLSVIAGAVANKRPATHPAARAALGTATSRRVAASASASTVTAGDWQNF